ncbi:hypothetical protein [Kocuria rosea]|uniref:hypothetical protein n=1 Tax=Kocuria rosea TaxID=1275 RepID=UPI000ADF1091|nr:hypothetical protein [Kocuria polaris]
MSKQKKSLIAVQVTTFVVVKDGYALQRAARARAIARAHACDTGVLEEELKTIASGPAGALMVGLDPVPFIESLPGVKADGPSVYAFDQLNTDDQAPPEAKP